MPDGAPALRVALAENSSLFRNGLVLQLTSAGLDVTDACESAEDLMPAIRERRPDIVLLDIRMPPTETDEGLVAAAQIRRELPDVGILILSTYAESTYAADVVAIGSTAIGYLRKDRVADVRELLDALTRIAAGECVIDPEIVAMLLHRQPLQETLSTLTARERAVLQLMAEGRSNSNIANQLCVAVRTVEAYTASIFTKLAMPDDPGTNRRVAAVLTWLRGN